MVHPLDLTPKCWTEVDLATVTLTSTDTVSQLNDLSGNGNHLTQATAINQPRLVRNGIYGPYLESDIADSNTRKMFNTTATTNSRDFTIVAVLDVPAVTQQFTFGLVGDQTGATAMTAGVWAFGNIDMHSNLFQLAGGGGNYTFTQALGFHPDNSGPCVVAYTSNASGRFFRVRGKTYSGGTAIGSSGVSITSGYGFDMGTNGHKQYAWGVFPALTDAQLQNIEEWAMSKYGVNTYKNKELMILADSIGTGSNVYGNVTWGRLMGFDSDTWLRNISYASRTATDYATDTGPTTTGLLPKQFTVSEPDTAGNRVCVVQIGTNDIGNANNASLLTNAWIDANLTPAIGLIIDQLLAQGYKVAVAPPLYRDPSIASYMLYASNAIKVLCATKGVTFIDIFSDSILGDNTLPNNTLWFNTDKLHPKAIYHQRMAMVFRKYASPLLTGTSGIKARPALVIG